MLESISTRCISPRHILTRQDRYHRVLKNRGTLLRKSSNYVTSAHNSDGLALVLSDIEREYYREVLLKRLATCSIRIVEKPVVILQLGTRATFCVRTTSYLSQGPTAGESGPCKLFGGSCSERFLSAPELGFWGNSDGHQGFLPRAAALGSS